MSVSPEQFDFSKLPGAERLLLAQALLDSLHTDAAAIPVPPDHLAEIEKRVMAADAGHIKPMTRDELRKKLSSWNE